MKKIKKYILTFIIFLLGGNLIMANSVNNLSITKKENLKYIKADPKYFSGEAEFAILPQIDISKDSVAIVDFEVGVVNNWHLHSKGQYLYITEGEGRVQEWGKEIQYVKKGDVVWIPADVKHWHGAGETTSMSHLVITPDTENNTTTWFEKVELNEKPTEERLKISIEKHKQNTSLTEKQLAIVSIAANTAKGDLNKLKVALNKGLDKGLTINEIREILNHQYAYIGFPRALNGMLTLNKVLEERKVNGKKDIEGKVPTNKGDINYYEYGTETLSILSQRDSSGLLQNFDGVDYALKAHLFGYLFSRDNLNYVNRELTTVSTISTISGGEAQLASHVNLITNLGIKKSDLEKVVNILNKEVDSDSSNRLKGVVEK
ncbi:cupin domain protein [Leptotrichia wadei]|uniref:Cupin domain protein n=2 Tax=Leptotrichia wadei TaxID=157687 RepID=A0A133ZW42_9FUSO|nr:cupin domain protein [Leptotrichia wadei]